jgi:hypothetical protein
VAETAGILTITATVELTRFARSALILVLGLAVDE